MAHDRQSTGYEKLLERVASIGWIAKGLVFFVIGLLALQLAFQGYSSDDVDQRGALSTVASTGVAGRLLVGAVGIGLLLFAGWQIWSAIADSSTDPLGLTKRIGRVGLGLVYSLLAVSGLEIALGGEDSSSSSGGGATSPSSLTERALDLPVGRFLVIAAGVGTLVVGAYHVRKAIRRTFLDDIDTGGLNGAQQSALAALGVFGFLARALLLSIVGGLFIVAAWQYQPSEAAGLDDALRTLADAPAGRAALAACAFGLTAAGAYDMFTFRRQRIDDD